MNPTGTANAFAAYNESARAFQAVAAEIGDYSRSLFADSAATMTQMAAAKSPPEAFSVWAAFNKRATQEYVQQMTKLAGMYSNVAKDQTAAFQALIAPPQR